MRFHRFPALLVLAALAAPAIASGQELSGAVTGETGEPLPGVVVSIPAIHRGAITGDDGAFRLGGLPAGRYTVEFTLIGYAKETRSALVGPRSAAPLAVVMRQTALELPGVIVTGKPQPTDALSTSQSVSVTGGRELERARGRNAMEAVANLPGVALSTTGSGIAKPVIRGLTSQRVLVLADGVRQEGQQWGDEHAPELDAFDVERVEVLRGPGSVMYGSDAIGGVVHVLRRELPSEDEGAPALGGELTFNGFSNSRHAAGNLAVEGAGGGFGYRGYLSARGAGDVSTPAGRLSNSGLEEMNGGALLGLHGRGGSITGGYSQFGQELEIHEDPAEDPGATPMQKIDHRTVHLHGDLPLSGVRLEAEASWQENRRREFEERNAAGPALDLRLDTYAFDLRGHHQPIGPVFGTIGVSLAAQRNRTLAEEKLIPGFDQLNLAAFVHEEMKAGRFDFAAGLRYDTRSLDVMAEPDLGVAAQERSYDAVTGNAGIVFRPVDEAALAVNAGRGWRSPTAFELFVDGVHEGTVQYLTGDAGLRTERSFNLDVSLRVVLDHLRAEATVFRNAIEDYIFASPTGEVDTESGFNKYLLRQSDATLSGAEIALQAALADWCVLSGGYNHLRGTNDATALPLPRIPPDRVRAAVRLTRPRIGGISGAYLSAEVVAVAAQNRVEEFETSTPAYALVNLGAGGEFRLGAGTASVDVTVRNLFDRGYRDHLNRFKEYSLNPGRDLELRVSIPYVVVR